MPRNKLVAPIVKWVGGKRQLVEEISSLFPRKFNCYCEPFLGGGAVLFSIQPNKAIINDLNGDLISVYECVRDDVESLIKNLKKHKNTAEYFYTIRDMDRDKERYQSMSKIDKASRLIYLNKTCFNGLFRVNSSGEFNSPFGHYKNPNIINEPVLRAVSKYFTANDITFYKEDFAQVLNRIRKGTFVYLDPPYDPISDTANFTGYSKCGFDRNEHIRLKQCCDELTKRKIKFLLSNSGTDFIKDLYKEYDMITVKAKRVISADANRRGVIEELLIKNYGT